MTAFVYLRLRKIWKDYALTERVPREAARLREASRKLALLLKPDAPRLEVLKVLAEMKIALESIARNIGKEQGKAFVELKQYITRMEHEDPIDQSKLEKVYRDGLLLEMRAVSLAEDRKQRLSP